MSYEAALSRTDPVLGSTLSKGSPEEQEAVQRFSDFFAVLSTERVKDLVDSVYAEDAYLNDTLKEHQGVSAIRDYFVSSAEAVESCTVEVDDVAESNGEYYFRWTMQIRFKRFNKGQSCKSIGISHIRFNSEGKIVFHQDYWDSASGLFQYVPLVGFLIRKIKGRI